MTAFEGTEAEGEDADEEGEGGVAVLHGDLERREVELLDDEGVEPVGDALLDAAEA